jgi:ABC-type nitrate/sulfonate/bicarbonate transport system permease component
MPILKEGMDRFVASIHAVPLIALGPLFIVLMSRSGTPTAIAALAAFFPVYVATAAGFDDTTASHRDMFAVMGSGRWARLRHLQLPAALPAFADGLRLAAPASVLGAILGEWFGAPRGIGILIVSSMQNFQIDQLWASAMLAAIISLLAFVVFGAFERLVVVRTR